MGRIPIQCLKWEFKSLIHDEVLIKITLEIEFFETHMNGSSHLNHENQITLTLFLGSC